jgi:hypothetical protein
VGDSCESPGEGDENAEIRAHPVEKLLEQDTNQQYQNEEMYEPQLHNQNIQDFKLWQSQIERNFMERVKAMYNPAINQNSRKFVANKNLNALPVHQKDYTCKYVGSLYLV